MEMFIDKFEHVFSNIEFTISSSVVHFIRCPPPPPLQAAVLRLKGCGHSVVCGASAPRGVWLSKGRRQEGRRAPPLAAA